MRSRHLGLAAGLCVSAWLLAGCGVKGPPRPPVEAAPPVSTSSVGAGG